MQRTIKRGLLLTWAALSVLWVFGWLIFFSVSADDDPTSNLFLAGVLAFAFGVPVAALVPLWIAVRISRWAGRGSRGRRRRRH
jgi:hypothetical protein